MINHVRFEKRMCPKCGYAFDAAATTRQDRGPMENDPTVCANCGVVGRFDANLNMVVADEAFLQTLSTKMLLDIAKLQASIRRRGPFPRMAGKT